MDDRPPPRFPPGQEPLPAPAPEHVSISDLDKRATDVISSGHRFNAVLSYISLALISVLVVVVVLQQFRSNAQQNTIGALTRSNAILIGKAATEQQRIEADIAQVTVGSCAFYQVIGTLPVVPVSTPGAPRTSIVGYNLIEGARRAYLSFASAASRANVGGCPAGAIGKPPRSLKQLAQVYHEPAPR